MDWKALVVGTVLILVLSTAPGHALPSGAPAAACSTLIPDHPNNPSNQTDPSPFELDVEQFKDIEIPLRGGGVSFTHSYTSGTTYNRKQRE